MIDETARQMRRQRMPKAEAKALRAKAAAKIKAERNKAIAKIKATRVRIVRISLPYP